MTRKELQELLHGYGNRFSVSDFGSNSEAMDRNFVIKFLEFRNWCGYPMLITSAYREGDQGAHGKGLALDVIIFDRGKYREQTLSAEHQFRLATCFGFAGVGLYFDWKLHYKNGETNRAPGIHIDELKDTLKRPLRWIRNNGEYHYLNLESGKFGTSQYELRLIA